MAAALLTLERQVDIVARLTERSRTYYDLYKFIEGAEYRGKILDEMNEYVGYFHLQGHVLRYALIVELGALFERKTDSVCLHALLKRVKTHIPHNLHQSLAAELDATALIASKISELRNKAFAHRDASVDFDDVFKCASITLNNIEELIDSARRMVDQLCALFAVRPVLFVSDQTNEDCRRLFRALGSPI